MGPCTTHPSPIAWGKTQAEQTIGQKLAAASAAAALGFGTFSSLPAVASEFDLAASSAPAAYVNDDANVLSKSTRSDLSKKLASLEVRT